MRSTPCVSNIIVIDEDLWDSELRNGSHTALLLQIHSAAESAGPVESIEKANDDVAAHSLFDTLKPSATSQEFFQSTIGSVLYRRNSKIHTYLKLLLSLMTLWWARIIKSEEN